MKSNSLVAIVLAIAAFASPGFAADFDGSKALICATIEARDCVLGAACYTGEAATVGAPSFIRIDFDKKVMVGTKTTAPIDSLDKSETQLLLKGTEQGYGWVFALNQETGDFAASMTNFDGSFLLFGSCTVD